MKCFLLLTLAVGTIATTTQARIGYTLDQCVKEYGPYKTRQSWIGRVYDFHFNDERITVTIQKDTVDSVQYTKPDGAKFDINEIDDILDENKGSSVWGAPNPNLGDGTDHVWLTTTGPDLVAEHHTGFFSVATKAEVEFSAALRAKLQKEALATSDGAEQYIQSFYKSTGSGVTVNSSSAFVAKTLSNANYLLAKADLNVPEGLNHYVVGIILSLDKDERITETQAMEESKFYKFVTTGDTALLRQKANLDVSAKPSSTPDTQAPTANRDKLKQLIATTTSDMSLLSDEELQEAAQLDAQSYYLAHKQKVYERNFAVARALKHNLLGGQAFTFQYSLQQTLEALAAADASGN